MHLPLTQTHRVLDVVVRRAGDGTVLNLSTGASRSFYAQRLDNRGLESARAPEQLRSSLQYEHANATHPPGAVEVSPCSPCAHLLYPSATPDEEHSQSAIKLSGNDPDELVLEVE